MDPDLIKKPYDPHNESYFSELKDTSYINRITPYKQEPFPTPNPMRFCQKYDYNMVNNSGYDDLYECFKQPNGNKNIRDFDKSPINDINKNLEFPLSAIWSGGDHKNLKRNYESYNGNSQNYEEFTEKKVKYSENHGYDPVYFSGKPVNKDNSASPIQESQGFSEKIHFDLFKKPMAFYQKKAVFPNPSYTPLKIEAYGSKNYKTEKNQKKQ